MPPKKQKKVQELELQEGEASGKKEEGNEGNEGNSKFGCVCGKTYGSLAAVHTHINNKHNDNEEMKKSFKRKIINPKKTGQPSNNSIRMKDILYPQNEAELMCLADITLKKIYDMLKQTKILIDVNEDISESDSVSDDYLDDLMEKPEVEVEQDKPKEKRVNKRQKQINRIVDKQINDRSLSPIRNYVEAAKQLQSFKIKKFYLSLIHELSKFFKEDFAAKIELSLQMIHSMAKTKEVQPEFAATLEESLEKIWREFNRPGLKDILTGYYSEWNEIRFNFPEWKKRSANQAKEERLA